MVAFRGTVTTEEWLLDADAYKDLQNPEVGNLAMLLGRDTT